MQLSLLLYQITFFIGAVYSKTISKHYGGVTRWDNAFTQYQDDPCLNRTFTLVQGVRPKIASEGERSYILVTDSNLAL